MMSKLNDKWDCSFYIVKEKNKKDIQIIVFPFTSVFVSHSAKFLSAEGLFTSQFICIISMALIYYAVN